MYRVFSLASLRSIDLPGLFALHFLFIISKKSALELHRKQRVVLNSQVNAGVPRGWILGPPLFLVFINDLPNGLKSNPEIFVVDTSLFSVIHDVNVSQIELNKDLDKINNWAYQWKMSLNPDPSKKAQEVIFSRKINNVLHPPLTFNNVDVGLIRSQKDLRMFLDFKLSFNKHLEIVLAKVSRGIAIVCKLQSVLPREALLTIHKSFIRRLLFYYSLF